MARNTFFSFDFDDVRAANIVRNSNVVRASEKKMAFRDHSLYERVKATDASIKKAIDDGVENTSVTVICTGGNTWASRWVRYEIAKSLERGNGLMVVDVDGVGLAPQPTKGPTPLDYMAAFPWTAQGAVASLLGGSGFSLREWNAATGSWTDFGMLSSISNSKASYPQSFVNGNSYKLSDKFNRRYHWNSAQLYFETYLNSVAEDVGHRRTGALWI